MRSNMEPMLLPGVENNPQPGPYCELIKMMKAAGAEYSQIWHLFAFRQAAGEHLSRFTQELMRGPAPLSPGVRELIAAFTSSRNHCLF
jgi:alkylhydroperoxidase family enzyme